jgi:FeS assembly ATPase SufC/FeS assembly protein SufD
MFFMMLEIKNLAVSKDGKMILKGLNLSMQPGHIHAIMGPNGAGKSTLAKVLAGDPSYAVEQGDILFNGVSILELEPEERAHKGIFMGFQYPVEIPGITNVQFLLAALNAKKKALGQNLLSEEVFNKLLEEKMIAAQIKKEFTERNINEGFSGGEKKRNEILQMSILDPLLAILDETDSGLDIDAMKIVAKGVNDFMRPDKALLLITHYQRLLDYIKPDHVHVLIDGKIVHSGDFSLALELESRGYDWLSEKEVLDLFGSLLKTSEVSTWQAQAWKKLQSIGLPEKKEEAFQYVSLRKLYESLLTEKASSEKPFEFDLASLILPESQNSYVVFKDGSFCSELSKLPSSLIVLPLEEALKSSYATFLKHHMNLLLEQEKDPWALLNSALCKQGIFVYVPAKTQLKSPIQVLHVQTDPSGLYCGPRVHLFLGAHAEVQMVSSFYSGPNSKTLCNDYLDVSLEEKASFSHVLSNENQSSCWGFSSFRASLKKDSKLSSCMVTFGSPGFRRDYFISLLGERAEAELKGLTAIGDHAEGHVHIHMEHAAPGCRSHQFFKNVLADHSRSSFTGKIYVRRIAQKTEAYQLNQNLLLSDFATANTKPNLEIFADDVKASHGATVSQLDEEQIFYLRTRGVPLLQAKSLLAVGFCRQVLDEIKVASLRHKLSEVCQQFLLNQG